MKTLMKSTDTENNIEAKVIETKKGFALIVRDLDAEELITRVDSEDIKPLLDRFNKFDEAARRAKGIA